MKLVLRQFVFLQSVSGKKFFLTKSSLKYINIEVFGSKLYRLSIFRNVYRELKLVN